MTGKVASPKCGRFLVDLRRRHGLSQQEMGERTGMTQANISRIERDKASPSLATLNRLLEAMGETLEISSVPLGAAPKGGGNVSIRRLREDFDLLTPSQRLEQTALLSRAVSELAAGRPGA